VCCNAEHPAHPARLRNPTLAVIGNLQKLGDLAWQELTTLLTPETEIDELLRIAIEHRRIVRLRYRNNNRIVEPHDYGIQNGRLRLLAYQIGGSSSGPLPNWRWMDVDQISDLQVLDRTFEGGRQTPSGKHHKWDRLYSRVRPADGQPNGIE